MLYKWSDSIEKGNYQSLLVEAGSLIFTPKRTPHRIEFQKESVFISISKLSRKKMNYDADTIKIDENFLLN